MARKPRQALQPKDTDESRFQRPTLFTINDLRNLGPSPTGRSYLEQARTIWELVARQRKDTNRELQKAASSKEIDPNVALIIRNALEFSSLIIEEGLASDPLNSPSGNMINGFRD